jgi:sigma-B regulation protein RsbU (phosphoserine phosphatase)
MLPHTFPPFPDRKEFDIYATMDAAREIGGDFYDFYFLDDDHLCLVMADDSGKGIPAALFMMISKVLLKSFATMSESARW